MRVSVSASPPRLPAMTLPRGRPFPYIFARSSKRVPLAPPPPCRPRPPRHGLLVWPPSSGARVRASASVGADHQLVTSPREMNFVWPHHLLKRCIHTTSFRISDMHRVRALYNTSCSHLVHIDHASTAPPCRQRSPNYPGSQRAHACIPFGPRSWYSEFLPRSHTSKPSLTPLQGCHGDPPALRHHVAPPAATLYARRSSLTHTKGLT